MGSWNRLSHIDIYVLTVDRLGQQIQADKPDFDTRSYGKRKLSDLVAELKVFETKPGPGNQILVRRID